MGINLDRHTLLGVQFCVFLVGYSEFVSLESCNSIKLYKSEPLAEFFILISQFNLEIVITAH